MDESLLRVITTLNRIADTSLVWPQGMLNPGGPHRRLKGHHDPISIGEDECAAFGRLVAALRPAHAFIIGNAFGFSSSYIADVMQKHGGLSVISLDDHSEGDGQRAAAIARELALSLGLDAILKNKRGASPADIAKSVEEKLYDLIFIDGQHRHPQVTRDFQGVLPYSSPQTVVVFHDSWIAGVPQAVAEAKRAGFRCLWLPTSCEMILATRSGERFAQLQAIFREGTEDRGPRSRATGYLLYAQQSVAFHLGRLFAR
ncbi:MAG TPA: class I SAM-dependent methyltransferase [Polyangiales bacterium]